MASIASTTFAKSGRFIPGVRTLLNNSTAARCRGQRPEPGAVDAVPAEAANWERAPATGVVSGDPHTETVFEAECRRQMADVIPGHQHDAILG